MSQELSDIGQTDVDGMYNMLAFLTSADGPTSLRVSLGSHEQDDAGHE